MASVLDLIKHYQHAIDKYPNDEQKILKSIDKLFHLNVTVQHLQETGVGRTVNALRKEPGDVGQAARALVYKWKLMVASEESDQETDNNDTSEHNGHDDDEDSESTRRTKYKQEKYQTESKSKHRSHSHINGDHNQTKRKYNSSEDDEPNSKKSKCLQIKENGYKIKSESKSDKSDSESESEDSSDSDSESDSSNSTDDEKVVHGKIKEEKIDKYHPSSKHSSSSSDRHKITSSSDKDKSLEKHSKHTSESNRHSESASSKDRSHNSHRYSATETKDKDKHREKKEKDRPSEKDQSHKSRCSEKDKTRESSSKLDRHEKEKLSKSKSNDKERSSEKEKRPDKEKKHNDSSKQTNQEKHKSSSEKKTEKSSGKSDKHSEKQKQQSSKDKVKSEIELKEKSPKERHSTEKSKEKSSSSKDKERKENRSSSSDVSKEKKSRSDKSDSRKDKHRSSSKNNEIPKKKILSNGDSDDGIGCESGASFAEALGMVSPVKAKKKQTKDNQSPNSSFNGDLSPASMLAPDAKLAPLPNIEISALPEISPNYKPRPPPKFLPHFDDIDLSSVMSSKNQRTKVYSGNKVIGKIPTLYEMCVQILQEHIDALEYTGGVPYEILKPVVDRATPQQLFMLEHYNPYLMEDTDHLWQKCCEKHFRNKKRMEMETWREMYMRCQEEQEIKLKSLTENIKIAQEAKKAPIKQTKMAYVDTVVKPPRSVARKQAQHGTAFAATASPAARVAALAAAPNVLKGGRPTPVTTMSPFVKPKKAPLMQKALQFMRGRKR